MSLPYVDLVPVGDVYDSGGWTLGGSSPQATFWQSTNADNTSANYAQIGVFGSFSCALQPGPAALSIESVTVTMSVIDDLVGGGQVRPYLEYGGVSDLGDWYTLPDTSYHTVERTITRGGGAWTPAQLRLARIGFASGVPAVGGRHAVSYLRARVYYVPAPPESDAARDVASRRVWLRRPRRSGGFVEITGPAEWYQLYRPGDRVRLSHIAGPHATAEGWTSDDLTRRPLWVEAVTWNPDEMTVTLRCIDHRPKLCLYYDSGFASVAGVANDGLMVMARGAARTVNRDSSAEVLDATGQLATVPADSEAFADRGQVFQEARTNYLLNSAFALGANTHWTRSGMFSNGSDLLEGTDIGLWTSDLTAYTMRIIGGSPAHVADLQSISDAVPGRTGLHSVSLYHQDAGGPLWAAVQRSIDSKWWRAGTSSWTSSKTWNELPEQAVWGRSFLRNIDVGGLSTDLYVLVGIPSAFAIPGQSHDVAHIQLEAGAFPGSPILTLGAGASRAADSLTMPNAAGARLLSVDQFTLLLEIEPFWRYDEATGTVYGVYACEHDEDNRFRIFYQPDGADSAWHAEMVVGGVFYYATAKHSPFPERYLLCARYAPLAAGEPSTLQLRLFDANADVVAIGSVVPSGSMAETSDSEIHIGHLGGSSQFCGYIRQRFSSPQALTDAEIWRGI